MSHHTEWEPCNVKALVRNVELVFKSGSIERLNKSTSKFISLNMINFTSLCDVKGFKAQYQDLRDFCQKLQTSIYSADYDHNLNRADRIETDSFFPERYGEAYNRRSAAQAIRGIVAVARKHADKVAKVFGKREKEQDLAVASRLLAKHGLKLP
jgi:hypothetical protein